MSLFLALLTLLPLGKTPHNEDPERLARALDAIVETSLRSDLYFLADDALGGRNTPSPQLDVAAKFLAMRLQRLGFSSVDAGGDNSPERWYHRYTIHRRQLDGQASMVEMRSKNGRAELIFGTEYFLYRLAHAYNSSLEAPVVSAGSGTPEELALSDLRGKWALVFDPGKSVASLQRRCQKAGALGLLLAQTGNSKHDFRTKFKKHGERSMRGLTTFDPPSPKEQRKTGIPLLMISAEGLDKLLRADGLENDNLRVNAGQKLKLVLKETRLNEEYEIAVPNVAGFWPGRDPELAKEVIIVSAHFDHVGITNGEVFNGADDNASGSTGLLAIAEALKAYGPMRRSVLLLWLSGEEKGLWGSKAWTTNPRLPEGCRPVANLNIDMIGRTAPDELYVTPTDGHPSYNAIAAAAYDMAKLEGFPKLKGQDEFWQRSDHYNFDQNLNIPVAFLSSGQHPDYHKASDTPEKIDFEKLGRITRTIMRLLDHIEDGLLN